ncbi:hypothetical protein Q0F98_28390 [Paenibacillus amylolyticus]|nr:hypothetical protein Q0F98_28390 [Paenibacillus amylolyticus]
MATLGQALPFPEKDWIRHDDTSNIFKYSSGFVSSPNAVYYNGTSRLSSSINSTVEFQFEGTKIRLIGNSHNMGSSNISIMIDRVTEIYSQYNQNSVLQQVLLYEKTLSRGIHTVKITTNDAYYVLFDAIDIYDKKYYNTLFHFSGSYYYYSNSWNKLSNNTPTEQDYIDYGMEDISIIPESAWSQLTGEVELCYYTDDLTKTEVSFNIETEPFTLEEEWADKDIEVLYYTDDPSITESVVTIETDPFTLAEEWEDKEIKIIEYTDDPNQTESTITIETEPFTLYDELGDSVDVLYYTDDPSKTSAELNITANYSPLDELEGDFDVVTWTNDEEVVAGTRDMMLTYNATV